jgi:hypothetical protein
MKTWSGLTNSGALHQQLCINGRMLCLIWLRSSNVWSRRDAQNRPG